MDNKLKKLQISFKELLSASTVEDLYKKIVTEAKKLGNVEDGYIALWEKGQLKKQYESAGQLNVDIKSDKSLLSLSLVVGRKKLGVLTLYSSHISKEEKEMFVVYGEVASLLLDKMLLYDAINKTLLKREEYISYASHELRNPLTSINGYIQLLHAKKKKDGSSESRWIAQLYKENVRFTKLLKEMLDIEKVRKRT